MLKERGKMNDLRFKEEYEKYYGPENDEEDENDYECMRVDAEVFAGETKIGSVTHFDYEANEDREGFCFLADISIEDGLSFSDSSEMIVKALAERFGKVYVCPADKSEDLLFSMFGKEIKTCPPEIEPSYWESGTLYVIEKEESKPKHCAYCGAVIEEGNEWFKYLDNYLQTRYFDDDEADNCFCSEECAGKALMLSSNLSFK